MTNTLKISNIKKILGILLIMLVSCEESTRFEISHNDKTAPQPPEFLWYQPTYGGVRIFYNKPDDKNLLSIDAVYTTRKGEKRWFSVSYFVEYIDVYGFPSEEPHTVQLYAVSNAGVESEKIDIVVESLQPAVEQVAGTVRCVGGFGSFYIDWENGLMKSMNIFVDYEYFDEKGARQTKNVIFTSRTAEERQYIRNPDFTGDLPLNVKVRVEDEYFNSSATLDMGSIQLIADEKIPKEHWDFPETNDSTIVNRDGIRVNTGVPMGFFEGGEGRAYFAIDDIIDDGTNTNFFHTWNWGRTGNPRDGNVPWNYIIDLGDEYELSRIITHQRYVNYGGSEYSGRMDYYRGQNVGKYALWRWDEELQDWEQITTHIITFPLGLPDRQYRILGRQGDLAWMYPENPRFTKPTRWFRYEALADFNNDYTGGGCCSVSEFTLYGRKVGN